MKNAILNLLRTVGGLLVIALAVLLYYWTSLPGLVIRHDMREYARQVRASSLPTAQKVELLDRIDALSDKMEAGSRIAFLRWLETNRAIRELLEDELNEDRAVLINRELRRVEERLTD